MRQFARAPRLQNATVDTKNRDAKALVFRRVNRVHMGRTHCLGQAIAFDVIQPQQGFQPLGDRFGHGGPATANGSQAGQVETIKFKVIDQIDGHRGNRAPARNLVAGDKGSRSDTVPTGQDDDGSAHVNRRVHRILHTSHMKERQRRQKHVAIIGRVPDLITDGRDHQ